MEQVPEEYELVPKNQLERLQREVEKVKRNPFGDTTSSKDLLTALDKLNQNVSRLVRIFETANDEIVRDYKDQANTAKINKVLEQNEKLAKGIVAIAELLKEERKNAPGAHTPQTPMTQGTAGGMPTGTMPPVTTPTNTPPSPNTLSSLGTGQLGGPSFQAPQQTPRGAPTFKPDINLNDVPPPPR